MSWREILHAESSDKRDKSPQSDLLSDKIPSGAPFSHFSHQDLEIEKKNPSKPDTIAVPVYFNELEREYYLNLVEFMESPEHRMDRETAEHEARVIVDEYRLRKKQRLERIEK